MKDLNTDQETCKVGQKKYNEANRPLLPRKRQLIHIFKEPFLPQKRTEMVGTLLLHTTSVTHKSLCNQLWGNMQAHNRVINDPKTEVY